MAGFILFWALYFLYDGYVGYPYKREIARAFAQYQDELAQTHIQSEKDKITVQWEQRALEKGWPTNTSDPPGHDYSDWDIRTQLIIGYLLLPWSLLMWVSLLRLTGRRIELDGEGVTASWGPRVAYGAITSLNLNRWKTKGIAVVHYNDEAGQTKRFVLDNFKYTRGAITAMVEEIESRLDPSQIVSNQPKPPA